MSQETKQSGQQLYLGDLKLEEENHLLSSESGEDIPNSKKNALFQERQLDIIRDLINSTNKQNESASEAQPTKSKKDLLKEKRDKKKLQVQIKKNLEENNSGLEKTQTTTTREERLEKQKIKNRESAQLSRDKKKQQDSLMLQDLQFLTEENKQLQSILNQSYTCQQCGYFNQSEITKMQSKLNSQTLDNHNNNHNSNYHFHNNANSSSPQDLNFIEYNYNPNVACDFNQAFKELTTATLPVQQPHFNAQQTGLLQNGFDYIRTAATYSPSYLSFGKGMWSTALVVFLLYLILIFTGSQESATLDTAFRQLSVQSGPYQQLIEQCQGLSKEQLLECLLAQLQGLQEIEQNQLDQSKMNSSNLISINENNKQLQNIDIASNNIDSNKDVNVNSVSESNQQSINERFLNFCKEFNEMERQSIEERSYYQSLNRQLQELQEEKLKQIQLLKQIYCTPLNNQIIEVEAVAVAESEVSNNINQGENKDKDDKDNNNDDEISDQPFLSNERTGSAEQQSQQEIDGSYQSSNDQYQVNQNQNDIIFDNDISSFLQADTLQSQYQSNIIDIEGQLQLLQPTGQLFDSTILTQQQDISIPQLELPDSSQQQKEDDIDPNKDHKQADLDSDYNSDNNLREIMDIEDKKNEQEIEFEDKNEQEQEMIFNYEDKIQNGIILPPSLGDTKSVYISQKYNDNWQVKNVEEFLGPKNFLGIQIQNEKGYDALEPLKQQLELTPKELNSLLLSEEDHNSQQQFPVIGNYSQFLNETDSFQEEGNLFEEKERSEIDYFMIQQPKNLQQECHSQHIACQYSFQPNHINSLTTNLTNSCAVNLQGLQNGLPQRISLLFTPSFLNEDPDLQIKNKAGNHLRFECQFVDPSSCPQQTRQ